MAIRDYVKYAYGQKDQQNQVFIVNSSNPMQHCRQVYEKNLKIGSDKVKKEVYVCKHICLFSFKYFSWKNLLKERFFFLEVNKIQSTLFSSLYKNK